MYAIINNNELIWFTDKKITKENMIFEKLIEWNYNLKENNYLFENWQIIEINIEKQKLEAKKQEILKQLWQLKEIKEGLIIMDEDTTEIDLKIEELKKEYKSL